jgi:hypothetical protein
MSLPVNRRRSLCLATLLGLALVTAACRGGGAGATPVAHPSGDALILRVAQRGGFAPPVQALTQLPSFSLLGDGRIVVPAAVDARYPAPLLAPLTERRLSGAGIQAILRETLATGLFAEDHEYLGARSRVMDAPDTLFELFAGGRDVSVRVYALGIETDSLSAAEADAHRTLLRLSQRLAMPDEWLPTGSWSDDSWHAFPAPALRLLVNDAEDEVPDPAGIGFTFRAWPGTLDPSGGESIAGWRCMLAEGAEATTWLSALEGATTLTRWTSGPHRYHVLPIPLLPDQPRSCA